MVRTAIGRTAGARKCPIRNCASKECFINAQMEGHRTVFLQELPKKTNNRRGFASTPIFSALRNVQEEEIPFAIINTSVKPFPLLVNRNTCLEYLTFPKNVMKKVVHRSVQTCRCNCSSERDEDKAWLGVRGWWFPH
ncbi:unnamed protein product [Timema podura]|uniref:Uncharacterized protein n=1 Tax=Timema podura TaxID=61482 RepID=A0ABN7NYZ7_TIMPD|nr:unnamed protein product [Timema podura]